MLKKNKLSLFLLAVVMMLTIYYVNMPNQKEPELPVDNTPVEERYAAFAERRLSLIEQRNDAIVELEVVLSDENISLSEKEKALNDLYEMMALTEKEILTEASIVGMGFEDAIVVFTEKEIKIEILTAEFTPAEYLAVARAVKAHFGKAYFVSVTKVVPTAA